MDRERNRKKRRTYVYDRDWRAVSEAIGYIVIFGLVVSSISLVYVNGVPTLMSSRETTHLSNTEKAYSVFQDNIEDISQGEAPSRGTEIKLRNSAISIDDNSQTRINVTVTPTSGGSYSFDFNLTPVVHEVGDNKVIYSSGGVISQGGADANSTAMKYPPDWKVEKDAVILPMIATSGSGAFAGDASVLVDAEETNTFANSSEADKIEVNITTPRTNAWEKFFEKQPDFTSVSRNGDSTTLTIDPSGSFQSLYFRTEIDLELR